MKTTTRDKHGIQAPDSTDRPDNHIKHMVLCVVTSMVLAYCGPSAWTLATGSELFASGLALPFDAIIVAAGGQGKDGPPRHVAARLDKAAELYVEAPNPKPKIITTARGTPHKPGPLDAAGFERHEAGDNARYLMKKGVPPEAILEESLSLETIGNAYHARVIHCDVAGFRRLVIVNSEFHMPRTQAVFGHVFGLPSTTSPWGNFLSDPTYSLTYVATANHLAPDVLKQRLEKERTALPRFFPGGSWQEATPTLPRLHHWLYTENTAYATKRLLVERKPLDPALLKSY